MSSGSTGVGFEHGGPQTPTASTIFRSDFNLSRELPETLRPLETISRNMFWSWRPDGIALFRELDPALWQRCEQNPRALLKSVSGLRLEQKACDSDYVDKLSRFEALQHHYLNRPLTDSGRVSSRRPAAYFCAEYGVHNSLPNYSGGLGILAGDHLKSASDLGVPLVAVGLLYRFGYFRQKITLDGWQEERYSDLFESELALEPVNGNDGRRLKVGIQIRGRDVIVQAWRASIGRVPLYLLDTHLEENAEVDRYITGHLYGGDSETRIVQEKVLGLAGVRMLRALGVTPSVYHLNEGHSAFLTLELAAELIEHEPSKNFSDVLPAVREMCVFTTHTPVAAGNDEFSPKTLLDCFGDRMLSRLKLTREEFLRLGRARPEDMSEFFGMTPLALRMCRSANGVSEKHGEVSRGLWHKMFPVLATEDEVPISHVTNGVHAPTWVSPVFQDLYQREIGPAWQELARDPESWSAAVRKISDESVWNSHRMLKRQLVEFIRERTLGAGTGLKETINVHSSVGELLDPEALTIGFARRIATYKRWNLLMSDLGRLLKMVDDDERPVQFIFAGKAHPQDQSGKQMLRNLLSINSDSKWQRRAVFIEDYDQEVARYLVHGVDVWMNVPRRPLEASGTSGQKAAMNGVLNFSVLDGWWIEGFNGRNGFAIGGLESEPDEGLDDARDAEALYSVLETEVVPAFYRRDASGIPTEWIARMKDSIATLTPRFSSDRMVTDYVRTIYR